MDGGGGAAVKVGRANNLPFREDCWTEEETATLIEAWGERYVELNRGNLRQKHWEEVADVVNGRHAAAGKRPRRTDIQCKNRVDTIKKKFKLEKSRLVSSPPGAASKWRFFDRVATLIGPAAAAAAATAAVGGSGKKKLPPPVAMPLPFRKPAGEAPPLAQAVVAKKRPSPAVEDSYPRRGFGSFNGGYGGSPVMDVDVDVESDSSRLSSESEEAAEEEEEEGNGLRHLARAIVRFAEIYERVEEAKQKQVFELEKQRMEFAKGLEFQRMQLFVDSQVNLEKMKRARRSSRTTGQFLSSSSSSSPC